MGSEEKSKRRLIYFLHIPKTAGTTFTAVLDNAFSDLKKLEAQTWNRVPSLDDFEERLKSGKLLHSYEYIRGHFGYGMAYTRMPQWIT